MNRFSKITLEEILQIGRFISENRYRPSTVVEQLGTVTSDNGYGTTFLTPKDPIFKVIWIYEKNNQIDSVGLGGPSWSLSVSQLFSYYEKYTEGYDRFDEEYDYVFYSDNKDRFAVKISSKSSLFDHGKLSQDINVYGIEIVLM